MPKRDWMSSLNDELPGSPVTSPDHAGAWESRYTTGASSLGQVAIACAQCEREREREAERAREERREGERDRKCYGANYQESAEWLCTYLSLRFVCQR